MPLIREKGIFMLAIQVLCNCHVDLLKVHKLKATEMLAMMVDTEDFNTYRSEYYSATDLDKLLDFKENVLSGLMADFETRKSLRPLADCIDKAKRLSRLK